MKSNSLQGLKMLLIEDDDNLRRALESYFGRKTSVFSSMETAEEALTELQEEDFDVIVCDYNLPGITGLAFFATIKNNTTVIKLLISGSPDPSIPGEADKIGVHQFIPKPFTAKQIENIIELLLMLS